MRGMYWQATVAWRGNAYVGWQRQPNGPSVQGELERAVGALCGTESIAVVASGRTDSGVHAHAQIIAFRTPVPRDLHGLLLGINYHLPDDIALVSVAPAPEDFCPRRWAKEKLYRYRILNRSARCPFRQSLSWHVKRPLDVASMQVAAQYLVGQHDFTSFRAAKCMAATPVRTINAIDVSAVDGGEVALDFKGTGFLRHQVRIMTGTLVDVGLGTRTADSLPAVITACERGAAGRTAPGHGLTLMWVKMGEGPVPPRR